MKSRLARILTIPALCLLALSMGGCQYFTDISNDLHDIPLGGYGRGGLILFGPGGGLEASVKATEFIYIDIGASEMKRTEYSRAPFAQFLAHIIERMLIPIVDAPEEFQPNEPLLYDPLRERPLLGASTFWQKSLGFPVATLYTWISGNLPEPVVARRSVQGRWYPHTIIRRHPTSEFDNRWLIRQQAELPPSLRREGVRSFGEVTKHEGLNSYMLISPFFDSALPVIDRFELGAEVNFLFFGLHLGVSVGQAFDFLASIVALDPANDDGRRWWLADLAREIHRMTSPVEELEPLPVQDRPNEVRELIWN